MKEKIKVFEGFAGYGGASFGLKRLKQNIPDIDYEVVGYSELDKYASIIRKTKRFDIPERAVYFLKTKRTAGGTPPPQNIFDRLTPVFT